MPAVAVTSRSPLERHAITVVLADDHPLTLLGLEHLLAAEPDVEVVGTCATSAATVSAVRLRRPDVLVLELRIRDKDVFGVVRQIRTESPGTRVVLLAASLTSREMFQAIRLGVKGIVLKEMPARLLLSCIRQVARGGSWLEPVAARGALERMVSREGAFEKVERFLTGRELEVFRLVLKGHSNRQIAIALGISEGTIKAHLHRVFQKLGIKRRAELFVYARSAQLI